MHQGFRDWAVAVMTGVPPVGVEPTLGTLLGGRPLPLGYGGWVMIPRSVQSILAQTNGGRKIRPGAHIQFVRSGPECEALPICLDLEELRTQRSRAGALLGHHTCARRRPAYSGRSAGTAEHLVQHGRGDAP